MGTGTLWGSPSQTLLPPRASLPPWGSRSRTSLPVEARRDLELAAEVDASTRASAASAAGRGIEVILRVRIGIRGRDSREPLRGRGRPGRRWRRGRGRGRRGGLAPRPHCRRRGPRNRRRRRGRGRGGGVRRSDGERRRWWIQGVHGGEPRRQGVRWIHGGGRGEVEGCGGGRRRSERERQNPRALMERGGRWQNRAPCKLWTPTIET
jgi:hypothetical protein